MPANETIDNSKYNKTIPKRTAPARIRTNGVQVVERIDAVGKGKTCLPERWVEYNPDVHPELVIALMQDGLSKDELAKKMGIGYMTLYRWVERHPEFSQAVDEGARNSYAWWLEQGRDNLQNRNFNYIGWMMQMSNKFGWNRTGADDNFPSRHLPGSNNKNSGNTNINILQVLGDNKDAIGAIHDLLRGVEHSDSGELRLVSHSREVEGPQTPIVARPETD